MATDLSIQSADPAADPATAAIGKPLLARLMLAMWLEFAVFGAWFATLGLVLATQGAAAVIGQAYLLAAVAAIVSPLLMGAIGDRLLARNKLLGLLHAAGALAIACIPTALQGGRLGLVLALVFVHMLCFQPTLGLLNCIALAELGARQRLFPYVRVFGPVGWASAGFAVGAMGLSASPGVFYASAGVGVVMALVSLTLPGGPPPDPAARFSWGDLVGAQALPLFRDRGFAVLMACALLTAISLGVYNTFASTYLAALGVQNVAGVMALGQVSELVFIVTIPWALQRLGIKWALLLGMGLWGLRFALFIVAARGPVELAYLTVILHGVCVDYFIVIAAMFIANRAPPALAAQAQSWLILMISGFGAALGSAGSGAIFGAWVAPQAAAQGAAAWTPLLAVPVGLALVTCVVWVTLFPADRATALRQPQ